MSPMDSLPQAWRRVRGLVWLVAGALALIAAVWLSQAAMQVAESVELRRSWVRHPATVTRLAQRQWVELEVHRDVLALIGESHLAHVQTPRVPDHVLIDVPRQPLDGLSVFQEVELARHPGDPQRLSVISNWGDAILPLAYTVQALVLLAIAAWLLRRRWGLDMAWRGGQWLPLEPGMAVPGAAAPPSQVLHEPVSERRGIKLWVGLFGTIGLVLLLAAVFGLGASWFEKALGLALSLGVLVLAVVALLKSRSRCVAFDDRGLCDASWFGARRVAWSEVARFETVNINERAQRQYDQASLSEREGARPTDIEVWMLRDRAGSELLCLPMRLEPVAGWTLLQERLRGREVATG